MDAYSPNAVAGRWSLFPGHVDQVERATYLESWCRLLLERYGVVFRDLLAREPAAPPWYELVRVLRRMELRGEVRGGRFVGRGSRKAVRQELGAAARDGRGRAGGGTGRRALPWLP